MRKLGQRNHLFNEFLELVKKNQTDSTSQFRKKRLGHFNNANGSEVKVNYRVKKPIKLYDVVEWPAFDS